MDGTFHNAFEYGIEKAYDRWYSRYYGVVEDTKDPKGLGRIRLRLPVVAGNDTLPNWAYPDMPHGMFWPPYEQDPVLGWFEFGSTQNAHYGGRWYGESKGAQSDILEIFRPTPGSAPTKRGFFTKNGTYFLIEEKEGEENVQIVWKNKDGDASAITIDHFGGISFVSKSGRRLTLDEENDQFFYSDVDGKTLFSMSPNDGTLLVADSGGNAHTISMPAGKPLSIQTQQDINITAQSVSMEAGSVALGGTKAQYSLVLGEQLVALLQELILQLVSLTVLTGTGPSSPPQNAAAIAAISGKLQQILSMSNKTA